MADDSGLKPGLSPKDKPPSQQGPELDLAKAEVAAAARVKKAEDLRRQIAAVTDPDEASAEDLKPLEQARQAARAALGAVPLTEAAVTTAAQELLRLQTARKSAAEAILKRLRALVDSAAQPLQDPSLKAPPDAEGAEWKAVEDAVSLATKTQQDLLASEALRSEQIAPLQAQVRATHEARDLALQAIQLRLRQAADGLLAKLQAPALTRVTDSDDSEWKPIVDLVVDMRALLDKPSLSSDDLRQAQDLSDDLPATLREVRDAVRTRLQKASDDLRIQLNLASRDIDKQRKGKLAVADASELQVVDAYRAQLDDLNKPGVMPGSRIAQAQQVLGGHAVVLSNVLAMAKARATLQAAKGAVHGDVRRAVDGQFAPDPAAQAVEKLRAETVSDPTTDRGAALAKAADDAVAALKTIELNCMKAELQRLADETQTEVTAALMDGLKQIGKGNADPVRLEFKTRITNDPALQALSARRRGLAASLTAATGYAAAVKSVPQLVAAGKRRATQLLAEEKLRGDLGGQASATGLSVDQRMDLLHGIQADLDALRRDIDGVQAAACKLPLGDRRLVDIDAVESELEGAKAETLETACAAWRKKIVSLRASHDNEIVSLRTARAGVVAGSKYLKDKAKLFTSGGTAPSRGEVESAIGATADPGYTLAAWGYTWDALLAQIRDDLKDGRMTQLQLDALDGGTGGQRYIKSGNHHISISFTKDEDMFLVTGAHVSLETAPENGRPRYWYSVTKGVVAAKPNTVADPNPSGWGHPANFVATANGLINGNKSRFNCK